MKKLALLALPFLTALPLFPSAMAEPAALGPRPGTVEAMQCLVRQGPRQCEHMFQGGARNTAKSWVISDQDRDFRRGPLRSSSYWGRASDSNRFDARILTNQPTREMDIFD